jgi:hypothetical protein
MLELRISALAESARTMCIFGMLVFNNPTASAVGLKRRWLHPAQS